MKKGNTKTKKSMINTTTIHIGNMCCLRCIDAVADELKNLKLKVAAVKLGEASFEYSNNINIDDVDTALNKRGFIVIKNEEEIIIENIKIAILDIINHLEDKDNDKFKLSEILEGKIKKPYRYLATIFKKHKNYSIEKFFILQKIEKTKELIENTNLTFSEVAYSLAYKSLPHLSLQFHQNVGMTMYDYKRSSAKKRDFIDAI